MAKYVEILGEKKFFGSDNETIRIPITLEMSDKKNYENTKFFLVDQSQQFLDEKSANRNFRFHGKVNMSIDLNYSKAYPNRPKLIDFDLESTFETILLKPTALHLYNGQYGETKIKSSFSGKSYEFDLEKGLPLIRRSHKIITGKPRFGFRALLGHDFQVNDVIKIDSIDDDIASGNYRIIQTDGYDFYINLIDTDVDKSDYYLGQYKTKVSQTNYQNLAKKDSNALTYLEIEISAKKMVDGNELDYYVKELEVIDKFDSVHKCGFSLNAYGQPVYNYSDQTIHDFGSSVDNTGKLTNEIYVGFIKKTNSNTSTVESNFSNLITRTYEYTGLETVYDKTTSNVKETNNILNPKGPSGNVTSTQSNIQLNPINTPKSKEVIKNSQGKKLKAKNNVSTNVGDILMFGLVSFNSDTLLETEINYVEHTYLINQDDLDNRIRFSYKPFYKYEIQKYSTYIEESDVKDGTPPYAIYNDKFGKYRWRDLLDIGFFEESVNGIDLPFLNGTFYVYTDINLIIKNHNTIKYNISDGGFQLQNPDGFYEAFGDLFNNNETTQDELGYKPFSKDNDCE